MQLDINDSQSHTFFIEHKQPDVHAIWTVPPEVIPIFFFNLALIHSKL